VCRIEPLRAAWRPRRAADDPAADPVPLAERLAGLGVVLVLLLALFA